MKTFVQKFFVLLLALAATCGNAMAQLNISFTTSAFNGYGVSCFTARDGWITVTATGGTPPYSYSWSNGATTTTISDLSASYYAVTVTDNLGAVVNGGLNLSEPEQLVVELTSPLYPNGYNVSLFNAYNGSITNNTSGGVSPFTYSWLDGPTTQNRTSVGGNILYNVTITDVNGCTAQKDIMLTEPERNDWTMTGNIGSNPATHYIGTADNQDLVVKANGTERIRVAANGGVHVTGQLTVDTLVQNATVVQTDTLTVKHITDTILVGRIMALPGDSIIRIGTGSINTNQNNNTISFTPASTLYNGLGIGNIAYGKGANAIAIGNNVQVTGANSISLGSGIGPTPPSYLFDNYQPSSLAIGFNTYGNVPTLFVAQASGVAGESGKIGIGTNNPLEKLDVNGGSIFVNNIPSSLNWFSGWRPALITPMTYAWRTSSPGNFSQYLGLGMSTQGWYWASSSSSSSSGTSSYPMSLLLTNGKSARLNLNGQIYFAENNITNGANARGVIQRGGTPITSTNDLGLFSLVQNNWIRFVTYNAPFRFYTDANVNPIGQNARMTIEANGNVGIGTESPEQMLSIKGGANVDQANTNSGTLTNAITFGSGSGEGIGSKRTLGGNRYGLDFYTGFTNRMVITNDGKVGIGTTEPGSYRLAVEGKIGAREIKVTLANPWPDYVFKPDYVLMSIEELKIYILTNNHLPGMISSEEVISQNGIELGEITSKLLTKIEELTLYIIQLSEENKEIKKQLKNK